MTAQEQRLTTDEFERRYMGRPYELMEGQPVKMSPTGNIHGLVSSLLAWELRNWVKTTKQGQSYGSETGFRIASDTVLAPDAAWINSEKAKKAGTSARFLPFAPDLAVEIVSPSDRRTKIQQKVELFQRVGVPLVWLIYCKNPMVVVHTLGNEPVNIGLDGTLEGGEIMPGCHIRVADLFPENITQD